MATKYVDYNNKLYLVIRHSNVASIIIALSMCPVVVRCDCVGDLQWRTDPLPCRKPTVPYPAAGRGAKTRETSQCSLCHRDVSVLIEILYYIGAAPAVSILFASP